MIQQINYSRGQDRTSASGVDVKLLFVIIFLTLTGCVMVFSASISIADKTIGNPFYYIMRHLSHVGIGFIAAFLVLFIPTEYWSKMRLVFMGAVFLMLALVLIPGVGREVNGSLRWLNFGFFNFQPSELAKLVSVIFLAGYIEKFKDNIKLNPSYAAKSFFAIIVMAIFLLAEPDMGAAVVIVLTSMVLLFLAGLQHRYVIAAGSFGLFAVSLLIMYSPYRLARLTAFMDPWADPFNSGFQLTQALIAFGRGDWFGAGIGGSVQKLFYLPEAHTDFLVAVIAEETGFLGICIIIAAFVALVYRGFKIGLAAESGGHIFQAFLAYGISAWIGIQAFVNIGVNMGLLPTKGITLPLLSYGGSSMIVISIAIALLFRIHYESYKGKSLYKKGTLTW